MMLRLLQHGHQAARAVQSHQIVTATHMCVSNENLRHGAPARDCHHVLHGSLVLVDTNFFDFLNTFGFQDAFGPNAVRANGGGVHLDGLHVSVLSRL